jgi:hypothetical protein
MGSETVRYGQCKGAGGMTEILPIAEYERRKKTGNIGCHVLDEVEAFLSRFVAYPTEAARVAHVLWIAHTHMMAAWFTTPRLAFMSAEKESGKTRALEVTEQLVPSAILSVDASPAYIIRRVAEGEATILYDEIDALYGSARLQEASVDVTKILNGGYRRGAKVHRCVMIGKRVETEELPSFAPVAMAGLKTLPDTLASRSIIIRMRRRASDEHVEQFRLRRIKPEADGIRERLAQWCEAIAENVEDEPEMPDSIIDRAAECWEPLFSVADAAGCDWPKRARSAALALLSDSRDETSTPGIELLAHVREAFGDDDKLFTATLLERLHERDESPWKDIRGKPLDDRGLSARLRKYAIKSRDVRIGGQVRKGYVRDDFYDSWNRYLGPTGDLSATSATSATKLINNNKNVALVAANPQENGGA